METESARKEPKQPASPPELAPPPKFSPLEKIVAVASIAAGSQFSWAWQFSLLTPYVQLLGIPHAWASLIWLCGPISGMVVQPIVGYCSDRSTSQFGRRSPFIADGAAAVLLSVPFGLAAIFSHNSGAGQGLSMGVLNLSIVIPQLVVSLTSGPLDELFGGGNLPAFVAGAVSTAAGGILALMVLPSPPPDAPTKAIAIGFH